MENKYALTRLAAELPCWFVWYVLLMFHIIGERVSSVGTIAYALQLGWIYTLGVESAKALKGVPTIKFKAAILYSFLFCLTSELDHFDENSYAMQFLILGMFLCVFYAMYVAAKMITSIELGRDATVRESLKIFFGIFIFPLGSWYVQNIMRKIVLQNSGNVDDRFKSPLTPPLA